MNKFKVSAIEKAYFYDIIIEAETKESAEEKFHEKYEKGEISPDEFGFEEIKIKKVKEVNGALDKNQQQKQDDNDLPIEIWDSVEKADYYLKFDYEIIDSEDNGYKYLYSKKNKMVKDFLKKFETTPSDELFKNYFEKKSLRGLGNQERTKNILINYILEEIKGYSHGLDNKFNELDYRSEIELVVSKRQDVVNKIVNFDIAETEKLIKEFINKNDKVSRITSPIVNTFLKEKRIELPSKVIDDIRRQINERMGMSHQNL